jgi:hypothetical protein
MTQWIAKHEFIGSEYDFVVSDRSGFLGYFSSAGFGPIPQAVAASGAEMYKVCDAVDGLEKTSEVVELSGEPNIGDWVEVAQRGLYAYDWIHERHRYELVARPRRPKRCSELDSELVRSAAERCVLECDFKEAGELPGGGRTAR